jgi:hypothetical protein
LSTSSGGGAGAGVIGVATMGNISAGFGAGVEHAAPSAHASQAQQRGREANGRTSAL